MPIYSYERGKKLNIGDTVLALGMFDGVHLGHRALIAEAKRLADERGLPLSVFTFAGDSTLKGGSSLYSDDTKASLLHSLGVENIIIAHFSELSSMSADDFVDITLLRDLSVRLAVSGVDFRFGKGRGGDVAALSAGLIAGGAELVAVPSVCVPATGEKISTASIKLMLGEGRIKEANALLGEAYFVEGKVEHGRGVGHEMGIPTVNLSLHNDAAELARGVYACKVKIGEKTYTGVTNIGVCPTFEERDAHLETFIIDFDDEIYDEFIKVCLLDFIRSEMKFSSPDALASQVMHDVATAKEILGAEK